MCIRVCPEAKSDHSIFLVFLLRGRAIRCNPEFIGAPKPKRVVRAFRYYPSRWRHCIVKHDNCFSCQLLTVNCILLTVNCLLSPLLHIQPDHFIDTVK